MFTTRPVRAAATSRSVCRDRNAGICRTSATSATGAACAGSWMSVRIGHAGGLAHARERSRRPSSRPGPRNDAPDVRFALSYDALKTNGHAGARARCRASASAMSTACASLSMTHGPGDEEQRRAAADRQPGELDRRARRLPYHGRRRLLAASASLCRWLASTKPANSGCGLSGFDLNSGWNCTATYHGMRRQLDDLDELAVERAADDLAGRARSAPSRTGS